MRLRHGLMAEGFVPYRDLVSVRRERWRSSGLGDGLRTEGGAAYLAVNGGMDVTLELRSPKALRGMFGMASPVSTTT